MVEEEVVIEEEADIEEEAELEVGEVEINHLIKINLKIR